MQWSDALMIDDATRRRLSDIRDSGDLELLATALMELATSTPLFHRSAPMVQEWIVESRQLSARCVVDAAIEARQNLRQAEVLLVLGQAAPALALARRAEAQSMANSELGLQDYSLAVAGRSLVRLGRYDDAISLLQRVASRQVHPSLDNPDAPALCFLAVGEAHLLEGQYEGASGPLEEALRRLSQTPRTDRLRWDALMALALLDHHQQAPEKMQKRLDEAMLLAERNTAWEATAAVRLARAVVARVIGEDPTDYLRPILIADDLYSGAPASQWSVQRYILDRVTALVGARSYVELSRRVGEQAMHCGSDRDLMGYLFFVALASAIRDAAGSRREAKELLSQVHGRLSAQGQSTSAANILRWHEAALGTVY